MNNKEYDIQISFSKYNTFTSCPIKYIYDYIFYFRKPVVNYSIALGYLTHLFLEDYIKGNINTHIDIINKYYDNNKKQIIIDTIIKDLNKKLDIGNNSTYKTDSNIFINNIILQLKNTNALFFHIVKNVKQTTPFIERLKSLNTKLYSENEITYIKEFDNVKYKFLSLIDLYFLYNKKLYVIDFKTTNKQNYDYKQNLLYAYTLLNTKFKNTEIEKVELGFYNPKFYELDDKRRFKNYKKTTLDRYNVNYYFEKVLIEGIKILYHFDKSFKEEFKNIINKHYTNIDQLNDTELKQIYEFINDYKDINVNDKREILLLTNDEFKPFLNDKLNLCYYCDYKDTCKKHLIP